MWWWKGEKGIKNSRVESTRRKEWRLSVLVSGPGRSDANECQGTRVVVLGEMSGPDMGRTVFQVGPK
jgi:hypothetical protein